MKKKIFCLAFVCLILGGCEQFRMAPSQSQKQNAWLHNRTTMIASQLAKDEGSSNNLQDLSNLSELQSRAFVSFCGLPEEFPKADTVEDILNGTGEQLATNAISDASQRPDMWNIADSSLELAIGICGLLGGVYGIKAAKFLKQTKAKTTALKEIIDGNELFKQQNAQATEAFKQAQTHQSPKTQQIVTEIKTS